VQQRHPCLPAALVIVRAGLLLIPVKHHRPPVVVLGTRGSRIGEGIPPVCVTVTSVCGPTAAKVTSTWLARSGSYPGCQVNATPAGGSQRVTVPHTTR
jgi:hypothetical protein